MIRTPEQTLQLLCDAWQVDSKELIGRSRLRRIVTYRMAALSLIYNNMGVGMTELAKLFNRTHTIVIIANRQVKDAAIFNPELNAIHQQGLNALKDGEASFEEKVKQLITYSQEIGRNEIRLAMNGGSHTMRSTQKSLLQRLIIVKQQLLKSNLSI